MLHPVGRINPKDYTAVTNKDKELLTDDLMKGVEGKGVKYLSSFFKKLTNSGIAKFHRLRTLFESGKWVNNNYVMKKLEKNCTEFNAFLNRYEECPNRWELREFGRGIKEMRTVCDFLRDKAPNSKKLAKIERELVAIEDKISAQTGTASAQASRPARAHAEMLGRANRPAAKHETAPPLPAAEKLRTHIQEFVKSCKETLELSDVVDSDVKKDVAKMPKNELINHFRFILGSLRNELAQTGVLRESEEATAADYINFDRRFEELQREIDALGNI